MRLSLARALYEEGRKYKKITPSPSEKHNKNEKEKIKTEKKLGRQKRDKL